MAQPTQDWSASPYIDGSGNRYLPMCRQPIMICAAVASVPAADLDFAGIALHADRKTVDKVLDKLRPHS